MLSARVAGLFDNEVIDGAVDGFAESIRGIGRRLRFAQRGQMQQNLAFAFAVAAVLIVAYLLLMRASPFDAVHTSKHAPAVDLNAPALQSTGLKTVPR